MSEPEHYGDVEPLPGAEVRVPLEEPIDDLPIGGESPRGAPLKSQDRPAAAKSSWPDIMGIIGIVLGAIGILSKMGAVFYPIFRPVAIDFIRRSAPPGTIESFLGFLPNSMVVMLSGLLEMGLAILLLIGGLYLKNRRQQGVQLLKIWAWISIPWAVMETGLASVMVQRMLPRIPHVAALEFPVDGFVHIGMLFGMMISLAIPIFVLAWFNSRSISTEVSGWPE